MRRGRPTRLAIAVAATGSGGDTTAPRAKHAARGISGTMACSTSPTASTVTSTSPMASSRIGRRLARKPGTDIWLAAT